MTDKTKEAPVRSALNLALEALDEIDGSVKLYHRFGPDWTHKDGTEVFEVSVLLDRSELIEKAITAIRKALDLVNEVDQEQPAQRPWVGLTDEEIEKHWKRQVGTVRPNYSFTRDIEAKLKEKNSD